MKIYILIMCVALAVLLLISKGALAGRHRRYISKARNVRETIRQIPAEQSGKVMLYLRKISPYVFEELILLAFEEHGHKVIRNRRYSGDGGIDGKVIIGNQLHYIQAKRYKQYIDNKHVSDFAQLCISHNVHGFFVHTGKTGAKSKDIFRYTSNIDIISGQKLIDFLVYKKG